jgi:hemerythrin-like domain-containing protein
MNKKPTTDLVDEHGGIMLMLSIMEKVAERLEKGESVNKDHLHKIIEFLQNFADKCHHGKEEGILFPELANKLSDTILLNELLGEHKTGRDYIRGMSESLESCESGNPDAIHITINIKGYIALLTEHIRKENEILFPIVEKVVPETEQAAIEERFERLEIEVIGEGKHEEYHGWLNMLKDAYLS